MLGGISGKIPGGLHGRIPGGISEFNPETLSTPVEKSGRDQKFLLEKFQVELLAKSLLESLKKLQQRLSWRNSWYNS